MLGSKPDVLDTHFVVEQAARDSYARLLAFLVARSRDVAAAEDALAEAFRTALESWPRSGIPAKPEAWLLVAARRKLIDAARRVRTHEEALPELAAATQEAYDLAETSVVFPDERLELLFLCAHPAIEDSVRTPLMLQTVLGLDAARIASAFLVKPSAMGQRLTRAKAKIRTARLRFDLPQDSELAGRLESVLEAIYAAYGSGWDDVAGADQRRKGLAAEAISLARLVVQLMPAEPEAKGLLALLLHCEARRDARRSADGIYLPLSEQDIAKWSMKMIGEAEAWLVDASRSGRPGRFQFEAAIQSAHAQRARTGRTDWPAVALLYDGLTRFWPTTGALVARAAAIAEARGARADGKSLKPFPPIGERATSPTGRWQPIFLAAWGERLRQKPPIPEPLAYARKVRCASSCASRWITSRTGDSAQRCVGKEHHGVAQSLDDLDLTNCDSAVTSGRGRDHAVSRACFRLAVRPFGRRNPTLISQINPGKRTSGMSEFIRRSFLLLSYAARVPSPPC